MRIKLLCLSAIVYSTTVFANVALGTKEVLLSNDKVEVVRLTYPAGSESGMHSHIYPNRTAYFVKGGKLKLIPQDENQQATTLDIADGKLLYLPATTHNVKNVGDSEIVIIETEIK